MLNVEEKGAQQRSRISWLRLGDDNTSYFHNAKKERWARNRIDSLVKSNGDVVSVPKEIEQEILDFYKHLLGSKCERLVVDLRVFWRTVLLSIERNHVSLFDHSPLMKSILCCK